MKHKLVLELPEEVYTPLAQTAQKTGKPPEQLAVAWLRAVTLQAASDPLEPFIGGIPTGLPGWPDQHDQHLGETLEAELGGEDAGS
jgi:hypothetical protein